MDNSKQSYGLSATTSSCNDLVSSNAAGETKTAAGPKNVKAGLSPDGVTPGRNVRMDLRWAGGDNNRIPALAQELVAGKASFANTTPSALARARGTPPESGRKQRRCVFGSFPRPTSAQASSAG